MRLKAHWRSYLHRLRSQEIERIFARCPEAFFSQALELGAGDGYQSTLLARYARHLTATDINPERLQRNDTEQITYRICDAERIAAELSPQRFDLIFSSNLLEHIPQVQKVLHDCRELLQADGLMIHVMPSRWWKFFQLFLFVPFRFINLLEKLSQGAERQKLRQKYLQPSRRHDEAAPETRSYYDNNPKVKKGKSARLLSLFIPRTHGVSQTHAQEWRAFARRRWIQEFELSGFEIVAIRPGPLSSGYGFGWEWLRVMASAVGMNTEYVYIVKQAGAESKAEQYFDQKS